MTLCNGVGDRSKSEGRESPNRSDLRCGPNEHGKARARQRIEGPGKGRVFETSGCVMCLIRGIEVWHWPAQLPRS